MPETVNQSPGRPGIEFPAAAAIDLLRSPACVFNATGEALYLNVAWRRFAGLEQLGPPQFPWLGLVHAEHYERAQAALRAVLASQAPVDLECPLLDLTRAPHWFHLNFYPVYEFDPAGPWICVATDIQALKLRELELKRQASVQADMLNISVDCIKRITLDGNLVHLNRAGYKALGLPEGAPLGQAWLPLLPENVREAGEAALQAARNGEPGRFAGRSVSEQGEQFWDNLLTPVLDPEGHPQAILCVSREVTAQRQALQALQENEERLVIAARVGGLGIWDYDIQHDRLHCDDSWYRIMGRDAREPICSIADFRRFIHPEDVARATEVAQTAAELSLAQQDYSIAFRIIRPNGDIRWVRSLAYLQQRDGVAIRAIGFMTDITDAWRGELALRDANRTLEEEKTSLARKVLEDPLTGIANRRHLDSELARIWVHAKQAGKPLCVGMIDVDRFKQFNDRYGHPAGDVALRRIARALQSVARQSDLVARYGGEEFSFALTGSSDPIPVIEKFVASVADLAIPHADSPSGRLSISCGAVVATLASLSPKQLLRAADEALYEAKLAGRDRYVVRRLDSQAQAMA